MSRKPRTIAKVFSNEFMRRNPDERLSEADLVLLANIESKRVISNALIAERNQALRTKELERIEKEEKYLAEQKRELIAA